MERALDHRRAHAALLLAAVIALGAGCGLLGVGVRPSEPEEVPPDTPVALTAAAAALRGVPLAELVTEAEATLTDVPIDSGLIRRVAAQVSSAVVSIYTKTSTPYRFKLLPGPFGSGIPFTVPGEALGSAFFIHPSGYLLSNDHVVANAEQITARTHAAEDHELIVVARDPVYDLALLQVATAGGEHPAIAMGDSDAVGVGDWVIAVGNPLGLGHTVTQGIISQTARNMQPESSTGRHIEFLQTDVAINPGSSGGPLITLGGAWVGVNTAVLLGSQGISFSVPSSQAREFLEDVIAGRGEAI